MESLPAAARRGVRNIGSLTPSPQTNFYPIDPNVRWLWCLSRAIFWCFVFAAAIFFGLVTLATSMSRSWLFLGLSALSGLAFLHLIWPFLSYPRWGYAIRKHDFLVRSGVLFKQVRVVPFARIQHVDSSSGPIERTFGLANVEMHTAGSGMQSLRLPGLTIEEAERLRDYLAEVGHTHANI